jgi:hypothetical protein
MRKVETGIRTCAMGRFGYCGYIEELPGKVIDPAK